MSDIAIKVDHVSKTFRIPHEKVSSLRGAAVSAFKGNRGFEEFKVYPVATATGAFDDVSFEACPKRFGYRSGRVKSVGDQILMVLFQILTGISEYANIKLLKSPVLTARHGGFLYKNDSISSKIKKNSRN